VNECGERVGDMFGKWWWTSVVGGRRGPATVWSLLGGCLCPGWAAGGWQRAAGSGQLAAGSWQHGSEAVLHAASHTPMQAYLDPDAGFKISMQVGATSSFAVFGCQPGACLAACLSVACL